MSDTFETDREPGCAHPRESFGHIGLTEAEQGFRAAQGQGRLHHAWLITGPKGMGKATLAYRLARHLLGAQSDNDPDDPVTRQIAAQSHPDLLILRRPIEDGKAKKSVTVDEARRLPEFFSKAPAMGGWRVAIVDTADDMNENAANAILKTLEEPPEKGVVFLLADSPGRLLPTIRSRCRTLRLNPLSQAEITAALASIVTLDPDRVEVIARLSHGAPGRALALAASGGVELYDEIAALLDLLPRMPDEIIIKMAERLKGPAAEPAYRLALKILHDLAADAARRALGHASGYATLAMPEAWARLACWIIEQAEVGDTLNMDRAETIVAIFDGYTAVANTSFAEGAIC